MKQWLADHPKAKLMARKRVAILDAAHAQFLAKGYDSTTMEAVAAAAGVSIMTLYRHADDKADLFRAVVGRAAAAAAETARNDAAAWFVLPFEAALHAFALRHLTRLRSAETIALLRAVMTETKRFPDIAGMVWNGLVTTQETLLFGFLSYCEETRPLDAGERRRLASIFLDRIAGADMPRVLLGLSGETLEEREARIRAAIRTIMAALPPYSPCARIA
ncbi:TetR/AcrR family transcriptional regulator [Oricola nitratireducens]|jgi:TetR/AcrR family transcriptional regulator, mexJK operon transcriptional repressor|uniref:TetR/AcrR family transcriptional regulator n=1 Tax=Oricola nitratireducens TaxID=2775868 RepID=UPI0018687BF4|nr:TetR/AcrR family transcriptional regulator [Oricola nitratireducens]